MSESIYSDPSSRHIAWPTVSSSPAAPRTSAGVIHTSSVIATSHDARLLAILETRLPDGEPTHVGYARKERELGEAFAQLPIFDQRALHARLSNPRPNDALALRFARLTIERRIRLLAFLNDARRRAAVSKAGR